MSLMGGGATRAHSRACFMLQIWLRRRVLITRMRDMQNEPARKAEQFKQGEIKDVVVRELKKFNDRRGWLSELFRHDEMAAEFYPAMSYISSTNPGVTRGPHEHVDQADLFCFLGPSNFKLRVWDNRTGSP